MEYPHKGKTELAKQAECFETPEWAAKAILDVEIFTQNVVDPCCGAGVLSKAAKKAGYGVVAFDLHDWGHHPGGIDFLEDVRGTYSVEGATVFMNPPFSLAVEFVERCFELGARKVVAFQRFAWWESQKRTDFWAKYPPNRIYVCADRASCWRIDIPPEERNSGTPTAHAWFVWEKGNPAGTIVGRLSK